MSAAQRNHRKVQLFVDELDEHLYSSLLVMGSLRTSQQFALKGNRAWDLAVKGEDVSLHKFSVLKTEVLYRKPAIYAAFVDAPAMFPFSSPA